MSANVEFLKIEVDSRFMCLRVGRWGLYLERPSHPMRPADKRWIQARLWFGWWFTAGPLGM